MAASMTSHFVPRRRREPVARPSLCIVMSIVAAAIAGCVANANEHSATQKRERRGDRAVRTLGAALTLPGKRLIGSGKVCSCSLGNEWRDTVQVPDGWPIEACI